MILELLELLEILNDYYQAETIAKYLEEKHGHSTNTLTIERKKQVHST